jgi:sterol desaturase/sphingolipid hydroxylase (fatty acid hydroxylase superfamily)
MGEMMDKFMDAFAELFTNVQSALFEGVVQPLAFALGLGSRLEEAFTATEWFLVGLLQLTVMLLVIAPLQRWRPVEPVTDPSAVRTDVLYTLIHRLGFFRLALFFTVDGYLFDLWGFLHVQGFANFNIDDLWPGVTDRHWLSFVLYLVLFDFLNYWLHRAQHQFNWWWSLHALHHSQRQMTQWTDSRNHLLDDFLMAIVWVFIAQLVGIAPSQFVAVIAITQLSENLQHANLRVNFGWLGERLWISPRFHRVHHGVGVGHESQGRVLGGHNFGVLFPWWDMLLGTADFATQKVQTGVRDQVEQGRDYGKGFWSQQVLGIKRLIAVFGSSTQH